MLLIHVPRLTNRLGYTLNVIFRHILRVDFQITADINIFCSHEGPKLAYGPQPVGDAPFLRSHDLLFETSIKEQNPKPFHFQDTTALFPVYNQASALPFDPLAAAFFCLARYEEYLPHLNDIHGRFPATESLAYKNKFLSQAVVNRWALMIAAILTERFDDFDVPSHSFELENTIDIDAAFCYRNKGLLRTITGSCRDLFANHDPHLLCKRFKVLTHKLPDPFDTFDYIIDVQSRHPWMKLKFFPLMADYNVNDKPISYQNNEFRLLLQHLGDYAEMGLHTSYASFDNPALVAVENERLENILHRHTHRNRYHFLRLSLPKSYIVLIDNNILHDYTMGFADEPGFRAGTGTPYPFFDLESDCETTLTIHPFAAMDSTLVVYKKLIAKQAELAYRHLIDECHHVGCRLSLLWHNQNLCEDFGWEGWRKVFENTFDYADTVRKKPENNLNG